METWIPILVAVVSAPALTTLLGYMKDRRKDHAAEDTMRVQALRDVIDEMRLEIERLRKHIAELEAEVEELRDEATQRFRNR